MSRGSCETPSVVGGPQLLKLTNNDTVGASAYLLDPDGRVVAEVEEVGPGSTRSEVINLGSGTVHLACAISGEPTSVGADVTVAGGPTPAPSPLPPLAAGEVAGPIATLEKSTKEGPLPAWRDTCHRLADAVHSGDRDAARQAWLTSYLDWRRLRYTSETLDDLDGTVDGPVDGPQPGLFHTVEQVLWSDADVSSAADDADQLAAAADEATEAFGSSLHLEPVTVTLRLHEITEDDLRFLLLGRDEAGAHASCRTIAADTDATRTLVGMFTPALQKRGFDPARFNALLDATRDRAQACLDTGFAAATPAQQQAIRSALRTQSDALADAATALDIRRTT